MPPAAGMCLVKKFYYSLANRHVLAAGKYGICNNFKLNMTLSTAEINHFYIALEAIFKLVYT